MRDKNSAFEADSEPEGLGLGEGVRGGASWVGAAHGPRGRGAEGSVSALRDVHAAREG